MNIPLPFSLVNNNVSHNELEVMPAFWWMYNMYALARNAWKYQKRDLRKRKFQHIEFDAYAPDSMEEVITGRKLLEIWTAKAWLRTQNKNIEGQSEKALREVGKELLRGDRKVVDNLQVFGENMEKGKRRVRILKVYDAYNSYADMIVYYAVKNVMKYLLDNPQATFESLAAMIQGRRQKEWSNLGGQLMQTSDLDQLRADIRNGKLDSWEAIHNRYDDIWERYGTDKLRHAYQSLCYLLETETITNEMWSDVLKRAIGIQQYICDQVYQTRKKDYDNIYRKQTYRNDEEMIAAIGPLEENSFIKQVRGETDDFNNKIEQLTKLL
ncbi:MAG: DUF4954 family protein, partial [Salinivirgaceae bacterium]|nr:DUF4954 family protein [Salinivirgaceae bacterium]